MNTHTKEKKEKTAKLYYTDYTQRKGAGIKDEEIRDTFFILSIGVFVNRRKVRLIAFPNSSAHELKSIHCALNLEPWLLPLSFLIL